MRDLFPQVAKGNVFIISAPSGTGKTTLVTVLLKQFSKHVARAVTCTTRPPRQGEKDGIDYTFLDNKTFELWKQRGDFFETARIYDYEYGTPKQPVVDLQNAGMHVLLVIDVQGAKEIREKIDAISIFICPPTFEEQENRIRKRKKDSQESIEKRLERAHAEMKERFHYDYILTNDDEKIAYEVLKCIIVAEAYKRKQNE